MGPLLETERLLLRPFRLEDAEAFFLLGSLPAVIRYVGNTAFPDLDAARAALQAGPLRDYETHGFGRFACVWKQSGEVIGFSGLKYLPEIEEVELGYRFLPAFWGMGVATEAGAASVASARTSLRLERLVGLVHPENQASASVLRKLGFLYERDVRLALIGGDEARLYARAL